MNETKRLTDEQRRFAEEQHFVLMDFLERRRLAMDEYYDVLVFPFLEAVCEYDLKKDFMDDSFEIFAGRCMNHAVELFSEEQERQKREVVVLSLDYPLSHNSKMSFGDTIACDKRDVSDVVVRRLSRPRDRYRLLDRYSGVGAIKHFRLREVC